MDEEPQHPILARPWTYDLIRIDWRPSPRVEDAFIDLTLQKAETIRRLRFVSPTSVQVEKGFCGQCSGLMIQDIRNRGWDRIRIEVSNFEQDPGITFFAADVIDLDDEAGV